MSDEAPLDAVELATELTIAWLGNQSNRITAEEVPAFLKSMHETVLALASSTGADGTASDEAAEAASREFAPATTVRRSLASRDHIISMIDGKPYKALRRHLSTNGLTPEQYRERYNLKPDYPMVAPAYSEQRRAMAQRIGLGQRGRAAKAVGEATPEKPKRAPRAPKTI